MVLFIFNFYLHELFPPSFSITLPSFFNPGIFFPVELLLFDTSDFFDFPALVDLLQFPYNFSQSSLNFQPPFRNLFPA